MIKPLPTHNPGPASAQGLPRRRFIGQLGVAGLAAGLAACRTGDSGTPGQAAFLHGVASGDPLARRVILWTRVSPPPGAPQPLEVQWQLASDRAMRTPVAGGRVLTGPERDFTVKVDAAGLAPGRRYYYRFRCGGAVSPTGCTRTLALAPRAARLAVFSCANYPAGYFNAYADCAGQDGIDAAIHLGDYLYEYGRGGYASAHAAGLGRQCEPPHELLTLADYRRRYAQYRADPDLQALHAALPMIAVWDDHELCDDAWCDGAAGHLAQHGPFAWRKQQAIRAWHEWMPVRAPDPRRPARIYRSFDFGSLLSLHMLDTRLLARARQLELANYQGADGDIDSERLRADAAAPNRRLLGDEQCDWLARAVRASKARWQLLGQQVQMARMELPLAVVGGAISDVDFAALKDQARLVPGALGDAERALLASALVPCYLDAWDGYDAERERVFALMRRYRKQLVVLAGDSHNTWASNLRSRAGALAGVELATTSVSSPGIEGSYRAHDPGSVARIMLTLFDDLVYADTSARGYLLVDISPEQLQCAVRAVDTVRTRRFAAATLARLGLRAGPGQGLERVSSASPAWR